MAAKTKKQIIKFALVMQNLDIHHKEGDHSFFYIFSHLTYDHPLLCK